MSEKQKPASKTSVNTTDVLVHDTRAHAAAGPSAQARGSQKEEKKGVEEESVNPTRYGDWERAGRCIDF